MEIPDKLPNQFICVIEGEAHSWTGYVVVDSTINGKSVGGVRMMPDVTITELMHMARAMTLKYGFLGIPRGGVKAGIVADSEIDPDIKREILKEFGMKLAPIIQKRIFEPGMDMGIGPDDLSCIWKYAGLRESPKVNPISHSRSGYYTSLTVLAAAQSAIAKQGLTFNKCTAALEGFGNVGGSLAMEYYRHGVKVVAVSTINGAIYNENGFDIPELLSKYKRYRSRMIDHVDGDTIDMADLFTVEVDILSPCARSWSISTKNADLIRAKVISPGANCAVTYDAERILSARSILSVPHFVASGGGILGSTMEFLGCTDKQIKDFIQREVKKKIDNLLAIAEMEMQLPLELAEKEALGKFGKMQIVKQGNWRSTVIQAGMGLYKSGLLPSRITRSYLPGYLKQKLWSDSILVYKKD